MELLFGEAAETAEQGASERLRRWEAAFDGWLGERRERWPSTVKPAGQAWRRLLHRRRAMPWELTQADFEGQTKWMLEEGYSPATTANDMGFFSSFYRWCDERRIDPECPAGFNPAEGVKRPAVRRYREAKLLSREEAARLLRAMERDPSELGKRDYAFTLAILRLGAPISNVQKLKWGQIEQEGDGAFVRWREGAERRPLPADAWQAMQAALQASGRLGVMKAEDYIFAPLKSPWKMDTGSKAEDWQAERHLSSDQLLRNLKLYGRLAGIEEEKVTLLALHRTAIRMRMDEGADLAEMRTFLDSQEETKFIKYRLGKLPQIPEDGGQEVGAGGDAEVPNRKAKPYQPGDGLKYGLHARSQAPELVAAILAENIQGIEEEIMGLRTLGRGLLVRQGERRKHMEAAQLGEAYSLAARRLGELIRAEEELADQGKSSQWVQEILAALERIAVEMGEEPVSEKTRQEAVGEKTELTVDSRRLVEEIAALRHVLRNVLRLAMETEETAEYIRMVEIYGSACVRLVRLLKIERAESGQLAAYLQNEIERAILDLNREWGLS